MRILTWNVNVLRTVLDYHPFSGMAKKNVEGLLDELGAEICCFQEHKTRRPALDKSMACPGPYDGFWTFPRGKQGYSGVCTYVDSRVCVPLKAEEGITGLLLNEARPPWTEEEKIGHYPDMDDIDFDDETDGTPFDPRRLDIEGRSVVCDFGMFVLFNLYCPNETNETRRPYKLNYYRALHARVEKLMAVGREVIIAGDMNIMRAPIDSGEGGIETTAEQHYAHPARRWLDAWCAPKGPMVDVVRESFPDREGMFTCWNTKIDARPANYGSRIDYVFCSPGLRPWIKGGDILANLYGSDHCPVYIDLHDSIELDGETVYLRDKLNPPDRPVSTGPVYPSDIPRTAPEPPRFATKFMDEFSAKQRTLKSLWGSAKPSPKDSPAASASQSPAPELPESVPETQLADTQPTPSDPSSALGMARAAFASLDTEPDTPVTTDVGASDVATQVAASPAQSTSARNGAKRPTVVDLTDDQPPSKRSTLERSVSQPEGKSKPAKPAKKSGQQKLASFWSQPAPKKEKEKEVERPRKPSPPSPAVSIVEVDPPDLQSVEQDELLAQALADEDEELQRQREAKKGQAAPVWSNIFARKLPPNCTVHNKPCKDFIVKIQGPNKGKRFWLCSLPVGPGYDTGRSKRPRQDVDHRYRCDFFLWDSANSRKETPK